MDHVAVNGGGSIENAIHMLGSQNLFHEALSMLIAQHLGAPCVLFDDPLKAWDNGGRRGAQKTLFLIDGSEMHYEAILREMRPRNEPAGSAEIVALFNIRANLGIEKRAFEMGVKGFFYTGDSLMHLIKGLEKLLKGDIWVSRAILLGFALQRRKKNRGYGREKTLLTGREMQIIALVSIGASNEEIAGRLHLSPHTVKTHLYNIFKKTGVPNRFQAALWAAKNL